MKRLTRRGLIVGGAALGLPLAGLGLCKAWCRVHVVRGAGLSPLHTAFPASDAIRGLGERYIAQTRSSAVACFRRIEQDNRLTSAVRKGCHSTMRAAVELACRDDFRSGRTHCIDGWVLAQTELDIAALSTM